MANKMLRKWALIVTVMPLATLNMVVEPPIANAVASQSVASN
jgi:hypothetical protein